MELHLARWFAGPGRVAPREGFGPSLGWSGRRAVGGVSRVGGVVLAGIDEGGRRRGDAREASRHKQAPSESPPVGGYRGGGGR